MSEECPRRCTGVVAAACTQGKRRQHGKPQGVVRDDQPDAREGQAGRPGVAERFAVPLRPGNAGGGKGPRFKTDARRGEGPGDWTTYQLRRGFRSCRRRYTRKQRREVLSESRMRGAIGGWCELASASLVRSKPSRQDGSESCGRRGNAGSEA